MFTGDAEEPTEDTLVRKGLEPCNVLKVAHHGSNHSSTKHFLDAVQPEIALISLGAGNRYGHPVEESMARLKETGAQIYRTDLMGTIHLTSDGTTVTVQGTKDKKADKEPTKQVSDQKEKTVIAQDGSKEESPETTVHTDGKFDINTATQEQLESINGIGPSKAKAILAFLSETGPVTNLDQLEQVRGIGKKTVKKITDKAFATP